MNLKKLQEKISKIIEKLGTDDIEIYTYADYGQTPESCAQIAINYLEKSELKNGELPYSLDSNYKSKEDIEEEGENIDDFIPIVIVGIRYE
jgi:hypothetical protein